MINFRKILILNLFLLFCTRVTLKDFKYISRNKYTKSIFLTCKVNKNLLEIVTNKKCKNRGIMMEELTGEWVILKDDEIIERNIDIKVILELAKKYEDKDITISKIPSTSYCFC